MSSCLFVLVTSYQLPVANISCQVNRIYDPGYTWLEIPYHLPVSSPGVCLIQPGTAKTGNCFLFHYHIRKRNHIRLQKYQNPDQRRKCNTMEKYIA